MQNAVFKKSGITILIAFALTICSCTKVTKSKVDHTVTGIENVILPENGSERLNLSINTESKRSEQISLSISGLPEGITANFNNTTGQPPFDTELYMRDDSSKAGSYDVEIISSGVSGTVHNHKFTLTTVEKTCAKKIAGKFRSTTFCRVNRGQVLGLVDIYVDPNNLSQLNFKWNNETMVLIVNCGTSEIILPSQKLDNYTISGTGKVDQNYSVINFDYIEEHPSGDTISCNMHMIKE